MAQRFSAEIYTGWARTRVFDYLADFRNLTEWHSAVIECELKRGEPNLRNARYLAQATFAGRSVPARITTVELERPDLIVAEAENGAARTRDRFEIEPGAGGSSVLRYISEMQLKVPLRAIGPLMVPGLTSSWRDSIRALERVMEAADVPVDD